MRATPRANRPHAPCEFDLKLIEEWRSFANASISAKRALGEDRQQCIEFLHQKNRTLFKVLQSSIDAAERVLLGTEPIQMRCYQCNVVRWSRALIGG